MFGLWNTFCTERVRSLRTHKIENGEVGLFQQKRHRPYASEA